MLSPISERLTALEEQLGIRPRYRGSASSVYNIMTRLDAIQQASRAYRGGKEEDWVPIDYFERWDRLTFIRQGDNSTFKFPESHEYRASPTGKGSPKIMVYITTQVIGDSYTYHMSFKRNTIDEKEQTYHVYVHSKHDEGFKHFEVIDIVPGDKLNLQGSLNGRVEVTLPINDEFKSMLTTHYKEKMKIYRPLDTNIENRFKAYASAHAIIELVVGKQKKYIFYVPKGSDLTAGFEIGGSLDKGIGFKGTLEKEQSEELNLFGYSGKPTLEIVYAKLKTSNPVIFPNDPSNMYAGLGIPGEGIVGFGTRWIMKMHYNGIADIKSKMQTTKAKKEFATAFVVTKDQAWQIANVINNVENSGDSQTVHLAGVNILKIGEELGGRDGLVTATIDLTFDRRAGADPFKRERPTSVVSCPGYFTAVRCRKQDFMMEYLQGRYVGDKLAVRQEKNALIFLPGAV